MAKPRPSLWPSYLTYWNLLFKHIHTLLDNIQASSMVLNQFRCFVGYKKNPFWVQKESSKMLGTKKILFGYKKNFISISITQPPVFKGLWRTFGAVQGKCFCKSAI